MYGKFEDEHKGGILSEIKAKVISDITSNAKDKVKAGVATKDGQLSELFANLGTY